MSQESPRTSNLVETTDCLEAISVIRCWKNLLFIIIFLVLLFLQVSFWLVSMKQVHADEPETAGVTLPVQEAPKPDMQRPVLSSDSEGEIAAPVSEMPGTESASAESKIEQEAKKAVAEPNQPEQKRIGFSLVLREKHVKAAVRFLNFILLPGSVIYCLTLLFALKVSLIGRLGGINHITRAFFLSLLFVILLLPWQLLFAPVFAGAMWTPTELINACAAVKTRFAFVCLYLRFTGYWLLVMLLLLFAQTRSMRWARATLRRLEVV